jgi:lysozyme family protein
MNSDQLVKEVLRREGGYVNHPNDRGGPTNFGITLKTLSAYRNGAKVTEEDVKNLSEAEAIAIYNKNYVIPAQAMLISLNLTEKDQFYNELLEVLFDMVVNHGILGTSAILAKCKSTWNKSPNYLFTLLVMQRATFYATIVKRNPTQSVFIEGWIKRNNEFVSRLRLP